MLQQISHRSGSTADAPAKGSDQPLVSAAMPTPVPEPVVPGKAAAGFAGTFAQLAAVVEAGSPEQPLEQAEVTDAVEALVYEKAAPPEPPEQKRALLAILEATEQLLRGATAPAALPSGDAAPADRDDALPAGKTLEVAHPAIGRAVTAPSTDVPASAQVTEAKSGATQAQVGLATSSQVPFEVEQSKASATAATLATSATATATATPSAAPAASLSPAVAQPLVLEQTVKLQGPEAKWGEQMLHSLRESVDLQVQQRMQSATIRLDPPELGSMEILLKHEAGHLSVQISASQVDVAKLLQQLSDKLRHELVGQNFTQVSVNVSSEGAPDRQPSQQRNKAFFGEEPVMAEQQMDVPADKKTRLSDVLVTV